MLEYKGYIGHVEFDEEAEIFHGEVTNISDVITFQGTSVEEIKQAFIDSIEVYLELCATRGEAPEKPYSGSFVVTVPPEVHKQINLAAKLEKMGFDRWIFEHLKAAADNVLARWSLIPITKENSP
jgi:predicted HicB family RNase H-like nuclease